MPDHLREYLRFFRDLGIEEIYLPKSARSRLEAKTQSASSAPSMPTTPSRSSGAIGPSVRPARGPKTAAALPPPPMPDKPALAGLPGMGSDAQTGDPLKVLQEIQSDMGECTRCGLHEGRNKIVFGSGHPNAKLVFVGEGPGADEDAQGLPFVGRAGQLLTQMIDNTAKREGIPISREDVYICNVVKCRPPGNRNPEPDEMKTCGQFLERQLEAIRPKAICVLGGTAAKYLLKPTQGITKIRGKWREWHGIPVMPTYHPSFLLRPYAQDKKREAWLDLRAAMHYVYD